MYICIYSCIPLQQLDPEIQIYSEYSLSLNNMIFKYTSESNFTKFLDALKVVAVTYLPQFPSSRCVFYGVIIVINYVFVPCNLTTGTPQPLCSSSCNTFSYDCEYEYNTMITYANLLGIPLSDDCENTFHHINRVYNYPNTSKDFENDCFDFPGTYAILGLYA